MARVAWIGLGVMGYPMAAHILKAGGHELAVYNRNAAKADLWVKAHGAGRTAPTPAEASADRNLTTLHRAFLVAGDPHAFLAKAPQIYALYYETGRRAYARTGERAGLLTTTGAETFSAPDCLTVVGWYRRALELCGATGVRVVEEECRARGGAVCRYRVSWG